jgi:hypothetical protein
MTSEVVPRCGQRRRETPKDAGAVVGDGEDLAVHD